MTQTLRDQIWDVALEQLVAKGELRATEVIEDAGLDESQRQTVRRTLRSLEEDGWLERDSPQSSIWRLGATGQRLLNVREDTIDESRR